MNTHSSGHFFLHTGGEQNALFTTLVTRIVFLRCLCSGLCLFGLYYSSCLDIFCNVKVNIPAVCIVTENKCNIALGKWVSLLHGSSLKRVNDFDALY